MPPRTENLSQKDAAKRLGISTTMLRKLGTRVSRNPDGSYPWPRVREDHRAVVASAEERKSGGYGNDVYQEQRARLTRAKAEAAELDLRKKRREVVDQSDVDRLVRRPLERVDATLLQAPDRYADELAKKAGIKKREARRILADLVELVRAELRALPGAAA